MSFKMPEQPLRLIDNTKHDVYARTFLHADLSILYKHDITKYRIPVWACCKWSSDFTEITGLTEQKEEKKKRLAWKNLNTSWPTWICSCYCVLRVTRQNKRSWWRLGVAVKKSIRTRQIEDGWKHFLLKNFTHPAPFQSVNQPNRFSGALWSKRS